MSYVENIHSLPIPVIKIPDLLLRDIDQTSEAFILLVEDVRANGVQVPLNVREVTAENGAKLYYLIDGRQRLGAAEVVGLSEVPVRVQVCSDLKAAMASARLNLQRSQPSPAAYAKYLKEYLLLNPATSFETLAVEIGQKPQWIRERLKLTELTADLQAAVDSGKISPVNGIALAKLSQEDQAEFAERAQKLPHVEFAQVVAERKKTIEAARAACKPKPAEGFALFPLLRSKAELTAIRELPASAPEVAEILNAAGVAATDLPGALKAGIDWAWQMDAPTVEKRRGIWEAEQARKKEEAARKKEEDAAKKVETDKAKAAAKQQADAELQARKLLLSN